MKETRATTPDSKMHEDKVVSVPGDTLAISSIEGEQQIHTTVKDATVTRAGMAVKQTMLIADGDAESCDHYRRFLPELGYEVETSSDGLDCVRKLSQMTPDVLVLDLELRWGGVEGVLGWLREEPLFLPKKVVLTSAETAAHIIDRLASPPVVKTLTKPFPLSALVDNPVTA
jgi:CheY-like chemotaxis protein